MSTNFVYYAKEDPWQDDLDGRHGLPVTLARRSNQPGSEAIWSSLRGAWEPFPDLFERLMGGDWWEQIPEERARHYFDAAAFAGGPIEDPLPKEVMDRLLQEHRQRQQAKA
ncbi:MAG: hypothetical protein VKI42_03695 [Synechococcaceae cyanobacterium]|nr:hypothetical protein [Synechococcaceae cyanobacterium]